MSNRTGTSQGLKKKKIAASAIAVALAAALMIGGTFSYLMSASDEVTNTFSTDSDIDVDITETDKEYEIIPGTSESKDPTVKLTASVDTYVYLVVEDNTDGLVDYEIDTDVWTLLYTYDEDSCPCYDDGDDCSDTCECGFCAGDGTIYVYYKAVSASDNTQSLTVLVDNEVSYPSWITGDDLEDASDITLSFTAYAIQMAPFCEASDSESEDEDSDTTAAAIKAGAETAFLFAYYGISPDENVTGEVALVCTESKIKAALADDDVEYIMLVDDIEVDLVDSNNESTYELTVTKDTTLNLQCYTLSFDLENVYDYDFLINGGNFLSAPILIAVTNGSLTIVADEGGTVDASAGLNGAYPVGVYGSDASVTINGGTYIGACTVVYVNEGSATINDGYFEFVDAWESYMKTYYSSNLSYMLGFMLNCYDSNYSSGTASITVYGGSYVSFNPANCRAEGTGTNFVADGYTVTSETNEDGYTVYTVVEESSSEENPSSEEE